MDFELARGIAASAEDGARLRRPRADPDRDDVDGRRRHAARGPRAARREGQEARAVASRRAAGVRRPGPEPARHGGGVGGDRAHHRDAAARARACSGRTSRHVLFTLNDGAEGEVSVPGAARREDHRVRAVGARRRLRSRRDAHHRRAPGRSLRHQRLQALDHRRGQTPISSSSSPRPTAARAAAAGLSHVPGRRRHAGLQGRAQDADDDGRRAL